MHGHGSDKQHAQSAEPTPNGVLEDSFYQATGRPLWNARNIYVPTLVIAGQYDTWSYPEDREGLMRDLGPCAGEEKRAHPGRNAFRAVRKTA